MYHYPYIRIIVDLYNKGTGDIIVGRVNEVGDHQVHRLVAPPGGKEGECWEQKVPAVDD